MLVVKTLVSGSKFVVFYKKVPNIGFRMDFEGTRQEYL